MTSDSDICMQIRCIHCLEEHYTTDVPEISYGEIACHSCHKHTQPMTTQEYLDAITVARQRLAAINDMKRRLPRQRRP